MSAMLDHFEQVKQEFKLDQLAILIQVVKAKCQDNREYLKFSEVENKSALDNLISDDILVGWQGLGIAVISTSAMNLLRYFQAYEEGQELERVANLYLTFRNSDHPDFAKLRLVFDALVSIGAVIIEGETINLSPAIRSALN